ncbi:MAG TPA: hypothetical protein VIK03_00715, partial [Thermoleophilia bacterium]
VAAAMILFLGGLAVGSAIGGDGHDRFERDGRNAMPGGGQGYGQPQAPNATQAPVPSQSTSPQALTQ